MGAPSIALTELSIRNFRGIESLDLDFRGPDGLPNRLVVLAGPNGCGKTSVLEAALLLVGGERLLTGPAGRSAIRRGAPECAIRGLLASDGAEEDRIARLSRGDATGEFEITSSEQGRSNRAQPLKDIWYFSSWRAPSLVGAVDPTVGGRGRRPAKTDKNRLRNVKQFLVNEAAIERFEGTFESLGRYSGIMREINEAWRAFYPGAGESFSVKIVKSIESTGGSFDVYFRTPEGEFIEVDLLSAGQLELFLFLSALALNENRSGIIFIDEPELHLDPQWHRLVLRTLMELQSRAQFIVATHSPEVYDEAKSYERHFLVPADDPRARLWRSSARAPQGV